MEFFTKLPRNKRAGQVLWFCTIFLISTISSAASNPVKVRLFSREKLNELRVISFSGQVWSKDNKIPQRISWKKTTSIEFKAVGNQVELNGLNIKDKAEEYRITSGDFTEPMILQTPQGQSKRARGELQLRARESDLVIIQEVGLEDYVLGVLPAEMSEDFPLEALKAQAVLARTYALTQRHRHRKEGYDFCDLTHCQAYGAQKAVPSQFELAVRSTRGKALYFRHQPIEALYHSNCGGHTSPNQKVFGGRPLLYLQGITDPYCAGAPHSRWESRLELQDLGPIVDEEISENIGPLQQIDPFQSETKGRIFSLAVVGNKTKVIPTVDFLSWVGKALGWSTLKSNWFTIETSKDEMIFRGRGLGHGVGLCQWGARRMAESGKTFKEILQFYFPGTRIEKN